MNAGVYSCILVGAQLYTAVDLRSTAVLYLLPYSPDMVTLPQTGLLAHLGVLRHVINPHTLQKLARVVYYHT